MKNLALPQIQTMGAYCPPLDSRRAYRGLLLDFNERTIPPSPKVCAALKQYFKNPRLQIYPEYFDLAKRIARYAKTPANQVMITNGSEQGMDLIFRTFVKQGDEIIIPSPSYSMFYQFAGIIGAKTIMPAYSANNEFPTQAVLDSITKRTKLIVICNPNNPTGSLASLKNIARVARAAPNAVVYVDEAYYEFGGINAIPLIKKYPNLIVTRTFSKAFGLVALRLGYLIARPEYILELLKVRGPYDINIPACVAAKAALADLQNTKKYIRDVMECAKPLVEKFFANNNVAYLPSGSNFILFRPPGNARKTWEQLNRLGYRTRIQNRSGLEGLLRVTIGTLLQMQKFIKAYQQILPKQKFAFLDRDGTLIYEPPDTFQIDILKKLKILPSVIAGLKKLTAVGYRLIIVSNQDGLGTKAFPVKNFLAPQNKFLSILKQSGINFEKIFICPHLPAKKCSCRKPKIGLIKNWLKKNKNNIDWKNSFVIGDRESDKQFAQRLKFRFVKMKTNSHFSLSFRARPQGRQGI